jgi:tRNA (guanine37-N1)-methyltransferase
MFSETFSEGILSRAQEKKIISLHVIPLRDHCLDKHRTADDVPFGGGPGMILKPEPIARAIRSIPQFEQAPVLITSAGGEKLTHTVAEDLSHKEKLIIVCGRYEGIDHRIVQKFNAREISIGDYVLTGGEFPAMVIVDSVARLIPGVLGAQESLQEESFRDGRLEAPQYTRPRNFENLDVPEVLLSGNHQEIAAYRRQESVRKTMLFRPELILDSPKTK